jgi:hypothetical protein
MNRRPRGVVLMLWLTLASCASLAPGKAVSETLFFGLSRADGAVVSDTEFTRFVDEVIEPRFPDGFTVWKGEGEWRGKSGEAVHEASRIVQIVHPPSDQANRQVEEIMARYKADFHQEAVLRVSSVVTISY